MIKKLGLPIAKYVIFLLIFVLVSSFAFGTVVKKNGSNYHENPATTLTDLPYSESDIISTVEAMQKNMEQEHISFKYNDSLGIIERNYLNALNNISNNSIFLSDFNSYPISSDVYLTWGVSYNYSIQSYGAYIDINIPDNNATQIKTFSYSSTSGMVREPYVSEVAEVMHTIYYKPANYGDYEFYYPGTGIEESVAGISNPFLTPPNSTFSTKSYVGLAGWIGESPYSQGDYSVGYYELQECFDGHFYYNSTYSEWVWNGWGIWYETTYNSNNVTNSTGWFPIYPENNWTFIFSISYNPNSNTATYWVNSANNTQINATSIWWPDKYEPKYAQYMTEASVHSNGDYQIPKFTNVTFRNPYIEGTNLYIHYLNYFYSNGDYNTYIMNLTDNESPNKNVLDGTTTAYGELSPIMYFNNSKYVYPGYE